MVEFQSLSKYSKISYVIQNLSIVIAIIGILGNLITFMVFLRPRFKKSSFAFYFKVLAITDTIFLLHCFTKWSTVVLDFNLLIKSSIICKLGNYTTYVFSSVSIWFLAVISFDRLSIIHNSRCNKLKSLLKKPHVQSILVIFIFALNTIFPIYIPLNSQLVISNLTNTITCQVDVRKASIARWIGFINITIMSFVILNSLSAISVWSLFKMRKKVNRTNRRTLRDRKYALNSIVLNLLCFVCKVPPSFTHAVLRYYTNDEDFLDMIWSITFTVFSIHNASLFFVNMCVNSIFCEEFKLMLAQIKKKIKK